MSSMPIMPVELGTYTYECVTEGCPQKGAQFKKTLSDVPGTGWTYYDVPTHIPCGAEPRLIMINDKHVLEGP